MTELGPVAVAWERLGATGRLSFAVNVPVKATARLLLPKTETATEMTVDGKSIRLSNNAPQRFVTIELIEGEHWGR